MKYLTNKLNDTMGIETIPNVCRGMYGFPTTNMD